ncbi:cell division protein FtsA, partial [bacterium]|nr:cell division protein FtsA [bacterium]
GIKKGRIIDEEKVAGILASCKVEAERMAGVSVEAACLSISSESIRSFSSQGVLTLQDGKQISEREIQHVTKNALKVPLPSERYVLHTIKQGFTVDGNSNIVDPIGLQAVRLEKNIHIVTDVKEEAEKLKRVMKSNSIEIIDFVFSPFAAAGAILKGFDKMEGALIIDLGGEVTSYALYHAGVVRSSGILPVGGFNISNDLSIGLEIPFERAEKLKIENGVVNLPVSSPEKDNSVGISIDSTFPQIGFEKIEEIVLPRCEEIFTLIKNDVMHDPSFNLMEGNIVLSGGGSKLKGIEGTVENVFGSGVLSERQPDVVGLSELVADESWNVSIGLLKRGEEILAEHFEEKKGTKDYFNWVVEGFKKVANTF